MADDRSRLLMPAHAFGLTANVQNNVIAVDETTVCYPVGRAIVLYNTDTKKMAFVREGTNDKGEITALALSPSKKYLAACERAEHAQVSIYHVASQRRTKVLPQGGALDVASSEFITAAFSGDSKMLAAVTGDFTIALWLWDKGRLLALQKNAMAASFGITRVSFNPSDSNTLATTGPKFFKLWRYADGQLKVWNVNLHKGREHQGYTDHCWLPGDDRVAACTDQGEILIAEKGELKTVLASAAAAGAARLLCLAPFARGFLAAGEGGVICVFEAAKEDVKDLYQLSHSFPCAQAERGLVASHAAGAGGGEAKALTITSLSATPSEELLYVATANSQLASFPLANIDILKADEHHFAFFASGGFHHAAITGIDVCVRKPLLITCGADKTLRMWNYATKTCEQVKAFPDEPLSVSLHPSGNHVLVGFSDKLRLFNVLMDDVRVTADLPVKACKECKFSNGGQYFAAVSGPHIHIFSTYTTEQLCSLKGHSGIVRCISWRDGDLGMASAGVDGAVYEWAWTPDGPAMDRVGSSDHVFKSSQYETVVCGPKGKSGTTMLAAGRDGAVRELEGGNVTCEIKTELGRVTQLVVSKSDRLVLAASQAGVIRAFEQPLDASQDAVDSAAVHSSVVSRLVLAHDEAFAFSASEDGHIFMFEMLGEGAATRERARRKEEEGGGVETDTVLVSKGELLERIAASEELEQKVKEQQMQSEYQSHLREQYFQDALSKQKADAHGKLVEASEHYDELRVSKEAMQREMMEQMQAQDAAHMKAAEELEHLYERKLAAEAARWEALRKEKEDVQSQLEERIYSLALAGQDVESKLKSERDDLRAAGAVRQDEAEQVRLSEKRRFEEMLAQEERDNDAELDLHQMTAHRNLMHEREEKSTLKGEQAIMRKKFSTFQSEMSKLKQSLEEREGTIKSLRREAADREKVIALLKKDVQEREESIADKERRMGELKAKNKELEKFKFVLDYKLRELAKEIEPRDEQIMQMRETIRELDDELQRDYKTSVTMEHSLAEKQAKIESLQAECKKTRRTVLERERVLNFFGRDVQRLVSTTDPHALREGVKEIYRSIVKGGADTAGDEEDEAVQAEFAHQRAYMERALEALKTRVGRSEEKTKADFQRKVAENEQLIGECNTLRREARELRAELDRSKNELQNLRNSGGGAAGGGGGGGSSSGSLGGRRPQSMSSGLLRPSTPGSVPTRPGTPGVLAPAGSSRGTLLKGPAGAMGRERARTAEVLMTLEANQREMAMQRSEILRLREQVIMLTGGEVSDGMTALPDGQPRPNSVQDRPMVRGSPDPRPPRPASTPMD